MIQNAITTVETATYGSEEFVSARGTIWMLIA